MRANLRMRISIGADEGARFHRRQSGEQAEPSRAEPSRVEPLAEATN